MAIFTALLFTGMTFAVVKMFWIEDADDRERAEWFMSNAERKLEKKGPWWDR